MPRYKRLRLARYNQLRRMGFLTNEARHLSTLTTRNWKNIPYVREMINERSGAYADAKEKHKLSDKEWRLTILEMYDDHDWGGDFWKMFRTKRAEYIEKHPEYDPDYAWKRKKPPKSPGYFDAMYESGRAKYPRGAAYH